MGQQDINLSARDLEAAGKVVSDALRADVDGGAMTEEDLKRHLRVWLEQHGWQVVVMRGQDRGIDVVAARGSERWVIEARSSVSSDKARLSGFGAILGELLRRMSDRDARYSIAVPDVNQLHHLWARLPHLAKSRSRMSALFIAPNGAVQEIS